MSAEDTAILQIPYILPAQAQKHVTHNEALKVLDVVVQLAVKSRSISVPPVSPIEGDRYIAGSSASAAWAGQAGKIAAWLDGVWTFLAANQGWQAFVEDEDVVVIRNGSAWVASTQALPMVGVNATADTTNRLSVSSPATLLNHAGNGHQLKLNKAASGDTGSILFQTGFSGRAEFGLAGNDNFSVKVSADGSAWSTGIELDAASGLVAAPAGLRLIPVAKASLPAAVTGLTGTLRYVSDATGGAGLCYCDGTNWRSVRDDTVA
jgi:hypothetical protein